MKKFSDDPFNRALIRAAIILSVGLLIALVAWQLRSSKAAEELAYQRQMDHLRNEVARIRDEREWTETYQPNYEKMVANGLIGPESRLEWRALIIALAKQLELPEVKMTFSPKKHRTSLDNKISDQPPLQVTSYESKMALDLTLFHSVDLLTLLDQLDQSATAILIPDRCSMSLAKDPIYLDAIPLIKSHCELSWVTIEPTSPVNEIEYY